MGKGTVFEELSGKSPFCSKGYCSGTRSARLCCTAQWGGAEGGKTPESPGRWAPVSLCPVTGSPTEQHGDACGRELWRRSCRGQQRARALRLQSSPGPAPHPSLLCPRYSCVEALRLWGWKRTVTLVSFRYGFYGKSCGEKRGVLSPLLSFFWLQVANSGLLKQKWTFSRILEYFMESRNWKSKSRRTTEPQGHHRVVKSANSRPKPCLSSYRSTTAC